MSAKLVNSPRLTTDELIETKAALGLREEPFFVPDAIYDYFTKQVLMHEQTYLTWLAQFNKLKQSDNALARFFSSISEFPPVEIEKSIKNRSIRLDAQLLFLNLKNCFN